MGIADRSRCAQSHVLYPALMTLARRSALFDQRFCSSKSPSSELSVSLVRLDITLSIRVASSTE